MEIGRFTFDPYEVYLTYQLFLFFSGEAHDDLDAQDFLIILKLRDRLKDYLYNVDKVRLEPWK